MKRTAVFFTIGALCFSMALGTIPSYARAAQGGSATEYDYTCDGLIANNRELTAVDMLRGLGYAPGEINTVVDVYDYYSGCKNITASGGGSDAATDDEYYALLRTSQDAYSVAGPYGAYVYHAKRASTNIKDVLPTSPVPGEVHLHVLMDNGEIADAETKRKVLEACNDATVRPLTDKVSVDDPEVSNYDIDVKYYISRQTSTPAAEVQAAVEEAVNQFVLWQSAALGRDINPSRLIQMMVSAGAKRVEVTSPEFTRLHDGTDNPKEVPQIAKLGSKTVTNGGYEDE